jgi:hypothetical protein
MSITQQIAKEIQQLTSSNIIYNDYIEQWRYLFQSYIGGEEYRKAGHLTRYQLESPGEYNARLRRTPLDNHCQSVISVYNSFLFREEPDRDFDNNGVSFDLEMFLRDADLDGRSLNAFMKDVSTWASVFGHCWIIVAKPNLGAATRAEEIELGVRPYLSLLTPLVVLDWEWSRSQIGRYELSYLKYVEDINGNVQTIKEWRPDSIRTVIVNIENETINSDVTEVNGLGKIPVVIAYNGRSAVRGLGVSDIEDIADAQRFIYNATSEIDQSIRMDSHPSLVTTPETEVGTGSGALIRMPENLDPGLKPYVLDFGGADTNNILNAIKHTIESIDKMANTGAVRAAESISMSGVAMETEFQLLNARLSEKADNMELAEEQIWDLFFAYQNEQWMGSVEYPGSFNIRDAAKEIQQLKTAKETATDPIVLRKIDEHILEWMGEEDELLPYQDINPIPGRTYPDGEPIDEKLPPAYMDATDSGTSNQWCNNCEYYKSTEGYCIKFDANVRPLFWCAKWEPEVE